MTRKHKPSPAYWPSTGPLSSSQKVEQRKGRGKSAGSMDCTILRSVFDSCALLKPFLKPVPLEIQSRSFLSQIRRNSH
ncbi:putative secreted protein [Ahrensia sp. R2A130]|nr:putative secreted protein [Ahrensia sp. R2A130]